MLLVVAVSAALLGASGSVSDTFDVPVPAEALAEWVQANRDALTRMNRTEVLWQRDGKVCIRHTTPRGIVQGVIRGSLVKTAVGYTYTAQLVHDGTEIGMVDYRLDCRVAKTAGGSRVSVVSYTEIALPRVKDWQVQRSMAESLRKTKELLQSLRCRGTP